MHSGTIALKTDDNFLVYLDRVDGSGASGVVGGG
jgi:hypothetical protein